MFFHQTYAFWHDYNADSKGNFHADDDAVANYDNADSEDNFTAGATDNDENFCSLGNFLAYSADNVNDVDSELTNCADFADNNENVDSEDKFMLMMMLMLIQWIMLVSG